MRPFGSVMVGALVFAGSGPLLARSGGFYYGGAYYRETPDLRPHRDVPTVPLPVPRPHFTEGDRVPVPPAKPSAPPTPAPPAAATGAAPTAPPLAEPVRAAPINPKPETAPKAGDAPKPASDAAPAAVETGKASAPLPPPKPADVTTPAPPTPTVAPSGATTAFTPRSPDDDPACPGRLAARHVVAETTTIGPQPDERCTVVQAVRLKSLVLPGGGTVEFPDRPVIACTTADTFSLYVRDLLSPLAKGSFGTPVASVWTGPGLECRSRDHVFGAKLSAHGQGLAIDIAQVKLADGQTIAVGDPKTDTDTAFETAARAGACGYFHTVLGPGSDAYHRSHWHFDLEVRGSKGDSKYCR